VKRVTEPFELSLLGGAIERRYRRSCPEVEALPWREAIETDPADKERARVGWTYACLQEYESAPIHAHAMQAMIRARMPLDLTAMSADFQRQELTHAEVCARLAMLLGGGAPIPDRPRVIPNNTGSPLLALAHLAIWAFAVSETYSHAMLKAGTERAKSPLFRGARALLAKDEAAHGRFGWLVLEEVLPELGDPERAELRKIARSSVRQLVERADAAITRPASDFGERTAMGPFDPEEYRALGKAEIERIVAKLGGLDLG
jgi:hypothetical protein